MAPKRGQSWGPAGMSRLKSESKSIKDDKPPKANHIIGFTLLGLGVFLIFLGAFSESIGILIFALGLELLSPFVLLIEEMVHSDNLKEYYRK